ncbi:MAG: CoA pyrophosphatase [Ilumatobacteraceae bacterium]|jgi:8-oxo-dGTP pyrophosphatase MutT (NUDIX family)|nr:CoA pyrophosphatase [Ilumatobacteraceae bacterium]MDP4705097.1 CoA pyrophosphatase [Ilumatobacteraceae bacterium]MDP4712771.1 CoA pyrophosphatase [Ilumatobacteraceae bacterium]MDP4936001.1 CoA pyrophosphatase [Ilumatobacteraceae bacterium]MDP4977716.1 CoA pyrophosphatase [Ilumatobacteraceae bacterium]
MSSGSPRRAGGAQKIPTPTTRRSGGAPAWSDHTVDFTFESVVKVIQQHSIDGRAQITPRVDEKVSAVLALLAPGEFGAEVLLTRRSTKLSNHQGEISFPGGRVDEGESIVDAALRETHEEVGVHPQLVTVHSELSPLSTFVSRSYIVPVLATVLEKPELSMSSYEVDRALWVPLAELVRADTFSWEWWNFDRVEVPEDRPMFFFHLDDETIWGATARMLHELLCVVHGVNHFDLPNW